VTMGSSKVLGGKAASQIRTRRRAVAGAVCLFALSLPLAPPDGVGWASAEAPTVTLPKAKTNLSLAWAIPKYPVGRQLLWLLTALTKPPVPLLALKAHFDPRFLAAVPPATFNSDLVALGLNSPLRVTSLEAGLTPSALQVGLSSGTSAPTVVIGVDGHGLIDTLRVSLSPALPAAATTGLG
jgi:hypothetical protein